MTDGYLEDIKIRSTEKIGDKNLISYVIENPLTPQTLDNIRPGIDHTNVPMTHAMIEPIICQR